MPRDDVINKTILTLSEINEKITDDSLAEFICFPQSPNIYLCIQYSKNLLQTALTIFPKISKKNPQPDMYALSLTLLLYSTNIELYNKCETLNDILPQLNDPSISYLVTNDVEYRNDTAKYTCTCSHTIQEVFMCSANNNFFVFGSFCIKKTEILSLNEQLKQLKKITCELCGVKRNAANKNIDICVPCSKKIYCAVCKAHSNPSKANPELCSKCSKCCVICPTEECNNYRVTTVKYCSKCMLVFEEKKRLEQTERRERERLDQLEMSIKMNTVLHKLEEEARIHNTQKCLDCETRLFTSTWKVRCVDCYNLYLKEQTRKKIKQELYKQECLKLQKEISDLNK